MADYPVQGPSRKPDEQSYMSRFLPAVGNAIQGKGAALKAGWESGGFPGLAGAFFRVGTDMATASPLAAPTADIIKDVRTGFSPETDKPAVPTPPPAEKPKTIGLPVGNSGFTSVDDNIPGRPGSYQRVYSDAKGNVVASGIPTAQTRGGFVGAATDAEAARNLQDRFAQDQAASQMAANFDRQTEALKSLRAAQMGVPRAALEPGANAQPEVQTRNPFSLPGDSFGDAEIRKNNMMSAISDPRAKKSQRLAALETMKSFVEGNQPPPQPARSIVNPLDEQRFLVQQQQANRQSAMDENRLKIDAANLQNNQAKTAFEQKKYEDESRAAFMKDAIITAEGAPREDLAAIAYQISKDTGVAPERALAAMNRQAARYNWKDGPPKPSEYVKLGEAATADLVTQRGR